MSTYSTTRRGLTAPNGDDALSNGDNQIRALAAALDRDVDADSGPIASRPVSTSGTPGREGRLYRSTNENSPHGIVYYDTGVEWVPVWPAVVVAHAASHAYDGTDPRYRRGSGSGTTDGFGDAVITVAHGLGVTPGRFGLEITALAAYEKRYVSYGSTNVVWEVNTANAGQAFDYVWWAER